MKICGRLTISTCMRRITPIPELEGLLECRTKDSNANSKAYNKSPADNLLATASSERLKFISTANHPKDFLLASVDDTFVSMFNDLNLMIVITSTATRCEDYFWTVDDKDKTAHEAS